MPRLNPRTKFLLRGSVALIAFATFWWFLLVTPLLILFRNAAQVAGTVAFGSFSSETGDTGASGNWKFWIPVDVEIPNGRASRVQSVEFEVPPSSLYGFTFGLPVYWALIAGAGWKRRPARLLALGTGVTAALEILFLLIFLKTYAHVFLAQSNPLQNQFSTWLYFLVQYLTVNVAPALAPFGVALFFHGELRSEILGWVRQEAPPAPVSPRRTLKTAARSGGAAGRSRR